MENKDTFKMTYSAEQQEEIQAIRSKYAPKKEDKMERLRSLDAAVNRRASMASIIVGIEGTILMGLGMSLVMSELGASLGDAALPVGTVVGVAGMAVLALAYPLYRSVLKKERKKIAPEILRLTDELTQ